MKWQKESHFFIAQLGKAHGVHGECKLRMLSPNLEILSSLEEVVLFSFDEKTILGEYQVSSIRGEGSIIQLEGVNDRTSAEKLTNSYLAVKREHATPLEDGEYYVADLIGMQVHDVKRGEIGVLRKVIPGASPVLQVARNGKKDLYIPRLGGFFLSADLETGIISVDLPESLLEIYE